MEALPQESLEPEDLSTPLFQKCAGKNLQEQDGLLVPHELGWYEEDRVSLPMQRTYPPFALDHEELMCIKVYRLLW